MKNPDNNREEDIQGIQAFFEKTIEDLCSGRVNGIVVLLETDDGFDRLVSGDFQICRMVQALKMTATKLLDCNEEPTLN